MKLTTAACAAAAIGYGSVAYAQTAQTCPSTNVCYSLNIPDATASSGSGDIYFQISAPTTYSWVALGQGSQMSGSNIFVIYTDASGTNVTLSPRLGTGHSMPEHDTAAQVTLLEGSGVSNGIMTANVRCENCESWSGGSMDFTSSSGNFIYATRSGSALDSDSLTESISQHGDHDSFSFDFSRAKGGSSLNPFSSSAAASSGSSGSSATASSGGSGSTAAVTSTCTPSTTSTTELASPTGSGCPTTWPASYSTDWPRSRPTEYASCYGNYRWGDHRRNANAWPTAAPIVVVKRESDSCTDGTSSSGSSSSSSGDSSGASFSNSGVPFGGDYVKANRIMIAHGVMACFAFVILFPFGAISIRLLSFPGLIWLHAIVQALAYLIYIIAFGLGVYLAHETDLLHNKHPIIGIVLLVALFFQPILGLLHHRLFKKYTRRTFWSHAHIWLGRIAITLGIINGGLGLQLAQNTHTGEIAYGVIAGLVWLLYVVSIVVGERKRRRALPPSYDKSIQMGGVSSGEEDSAPFGGAAAQGGHREWYGKHSSGSRR